MIKFLAFTDLHYDYATHGDERIRQILSRAKHQISKERDKIETRIKGRRGEYGVYLLQ